MRHQHHGRHGHHDHEDREFGHRGPRGFRRFAGAFGGPESWGHGFGGFDFRAGRKLAAGDLQLVLLALLDEKPAHGYELMKELEERSGGFYSPSPGMIYPQLTLLEELGYASVTAEGAKKLYAITDAGRAYLTENKQAADAMLAQLKFLGDRMQQVGRFFSGEWDGEDERDPLAREIKQARRELKAALRDKRGSSPEEAKRIADILLRAAADIRSAKT